MARPTSALGITALIAVALILAAAVVMIVFVPVEDCKPCQIRVAFHEALRHKQVIVIGGVETVISEPTPNLGPPPQPGCPNCVRGRKTLLKKWLSSRR